MKEFWKKLATALRKNNNAKRTSIVVSVDDIPDLSDEDKKRFKEIPPLAFKVFKSSGLQEKEVVKNWDTFLNCLYYSVPKGTFAHAPPRAPPFNQNGTPLAKNSSVESLSSICNLLSSSAYPSTSKPARITKTLSRSDESLPGLKKPNSKEDNNEEPKITEQPSESKSNESTSSAPSRGLASRVAHPLVQRSLSTSFLNASAALASMRKNSTAETSPTDSRNRSQTAIDPANPQNGQSQPTSEENNGGLNFRNTKERPPSGVWTDTESRDSRNFESSDLEDISEVEFIILPSLKQRIEEEDEEDVEGFSHLRSLHSSYEEQDDGSFSLSSALDYEFDTYFISNQVNALLQQLQQLEQAQGTPKVKKPSRKKWTKEDLEKMLKKANPKDEYGNFREIGKGSYGKVYIASKKGTKQKFALKQMKKEWDQEDIDSIANEIHLLDSCHHQNIVNYIASYLYNNKIWMVMEYCDAGTLKQLLVIELNEEHIANIMKQVLSGLSYLHGLKRIHRDIKSSNILLNMNGDVKVADLGLCIEGEGEQSGMAGSKYWMAPEMIRRHPYNSKVDIWSCGALGVEMAEGYPPYHAYKPLKALYLTATRGAPALKRPDKWTSTFKDFLGQCFKQDPTTRPTGEQLLEHEFLKVACEQRELMKALNLVFLMRVTAGL